MWGSDGDSDPDRADQWGGGPEDIEGELEEQARDSFNGQHGHAKGWGPGEGDNSGVICQGQEWDK